MFDDITLYEDSTFAYKMNKIAKSEIHYDKCLYFYDFNSQTTETQK